LNEDNYYGLSIKDGQDSLWKKEEGEIVPLSYPDYLKGEVELPPVADNTLKWYKKDKSLRKKNYGGSEVIEVGSEYLGSAGVRIKPYDRFEFKRGIIRFNLNSLPRRGYVKRAVLKLRVLEMEGEEIEITVHRVPYNWREGSGNGERAGKGKSCWWVSEYPHRGWDGSRFGTFDLEGEVVVKRDSESWPEVEIDITGLVRSWASGEVENFGLMLKRRVEYANEDTVIRFGSKEAGRG
jgi:ribosomal protein S19E (S16A)